MREKSNMAEHTYTGSTAIHKHTHKHIFPLITQVSGSLQAKPTAFFLFPVLTPSLLAVP